MFVTIHVSKSINAVFLLLSIPKSTVDMNENHSKFIEMFTQHSKNVLPRLLILSEMTVQKFFVELKYKSSL